MITNWVISIFNLLGISDLTKFDLLGFNCSVGGVMLFVFCFLFIYFGFQIIMGIRYFLFHKKLGIKKERR